MVDGRPIRHELRERGRLPCGIAVVGWSYDAMVLRRASSESDGLLRLILEVAIFVALPAVFCIAFLANAYHRDILSFDFMQFLLPAARTVAEGSSPYPTYGYPPLVAFAIVPFTVLPGPNVIFTALLVPCVPASLWLLGVRDWRCYGVVFAWAPVLAALQTGNVTIPLLFGAAVCWHMRERRQLVSVVGGLTVAAKLLSWPLIVWLAATRRLVSAVGVVVFAVSLSLVLWLILGFSDATDYPSRVQAGGRIDAPRGYTLRAVMEDIGVGAASAQIVWGLAALAIVAGAAYFGWRGDDRRSFALCMSAMIFASPISWLHSYAFLLGAVAVMRPRLSVAWLLPLLLLIGPGTGNGAPWQTGGVLAVSALTVLLVLLPERKWFDWAALGGADARHDRPGAAPPNRAATPSAQPR